MAEPVHSTPKQDFEIIYKQVRKAEQRWYTDEQVKKLPEIPLSHPHYKEWKSRARSSKMLIEYLLKKGTPLNILEVGCGNGWLCARLASHNSFKVVGTDVNIEELEQAKRVFEDNKNLEFIQGDIPVDQFSGSGFDIILFASSIQYFPSVKEILEKVSGLLNDGGEVHIMDTVFYKQGAVPDARRRTLDYYTRMGFPEAASYYHHHCIDDFDPLKIKILYKPGSWWNYFAKGKLPFYWIIIKKENLGL